MAEHPILFSGPLVRAILAGKKTQTRRLLALREFKRTETPGFDWTFRCRRGLWQDLSTAQLLAYWCPFGTAGDRLWVRETWGYFGGDEYLYQRDRGSVRFRADNPAAPAPGGRWRPSIHMPRWASRLTLEIVGVRVERLQSITEAEAIAEGVDEVPMAEVPRRGVLHRRDDFAQLWDKISGERASWASNPWVWVVTFRAAEGSHA